MGMLRGRKSGRVVKLWDLGSVHAGSYQFAEREDGTIFFRLLDKKRVGRWGPWEKSREDPRDSEGRILLVSGSYMRTRTKGLGKLRLPK